ncbi:D-alanyl-D-alanine dipeptidase [Pelagimonas phthalicica]|uniref:D-alanyl-D-alanine dipeptidase n=1 Tax=Pelagimonas phthalicica TaxID=1037362 RepID=A0A238JAR0_9RHOB|nr:M15 family metallopeptidase [Pelagimonas phthalicica]TDS94246.1 D-alanyl-D-alanine dipeptidase [Pelagimonas phthalicica]SMX27227.1 D-alanyl-D-alanine dipeptidase [Pelagimonas phthalicica]
MTSPQNHALDWDAAGQIAPGTSDEPLVPTSTCAHWITWPVYFKNGLDGALAEVLVRASVYDRLIKASCNLPEGYQLVLLDGWRSKEVQNTLFHTIRQQVIADHPKLKPNEIERLTLQFASRPSDDPLRPSPHITGGSVDVTLADPDGQFLDMGSQFDEPSERSWTLAQVEPHHMERRHVLLQAMTTAGFTNLPSEWWHFDYGNWVWAWYSQEPKAIFGPTDAA